MKNVLKGVASLSLVAMMITSVSAAGTGTGKAPGFYGEDFTVTLTVSNGQVTDVQYSCPTDDFGEDACSALAGKLKGQSGVNLDAVSDATISSNAFITAAKAAYDAAKANDVPAVTTTQGGSGGQTTTTVTTTTTKPVTTTTTTTTTKPVSGKPYTATAAGFGGDLSVTLIMENGKINGVTTDCSKETKGPAFGQNACKVLSEALVGKTEISLDNVSGATITTNAFIAAANEALNASKGIVTTTTPAVTTTTQPVTGETFSASEKGFGGDITVNLVG